MLATPVRHWLDLLKRGCRFCCSCGLPRLLPLTPEGVVTCDDCLKNGAKAVYCRTCGTEIPLKTRLWFKNHGRPPARFCDWHSPGARLMGKAHTLDGVECPREWRDVDGTVTVTGSGVRFYQAPTHAAR